MANISYCCWGFMAMIFAPAGPVGPPIPPLPFIIRPPPLAWACCRGPVGGPRCVLILSFPPCCRTRCSVESPDLSIAFARWPNIRLLGSLERLPTPFRIDFGPVGLPGVSIVRVGSGSGSTARHGGYIHIGITWFSGISHIGVLCRRWCITLLRSCVCTRESISSAML